MLYDGTMKKHTTTFNATTAMRRMAWIERRDAMAEGRIENKAQTIPNKRRKADKAACRGKVNHDG